MYAYSNWQGEMSRRGTVQAERCPAGKMSYRPTPCRSIALAKTNHMDRTGNSISQAVSPCDIDVVGIEKFENFSTSIVSRGNC